MSELTTSSESKRSPIGRLVRFVLKALGALLLLIVLAIVALNIYLSTRPAPKTVRPTGTIQLPAPFHMGRSFIDYMTLRGQRLYAGYATAGLVGVMDVTSGQSAGAGLRRGQVGRRQVLVRGAGHRLPEMTRLSSTTISASHVKWNE